MASRKKNAAADSSSVIDPRTARKKLCHCCPQTVEGTPKKTGCKVTKKTGTKTDVSVDRELRSKKKMQNNRVPRELINLGTNILDTSIVLRNDAAHENKKKNKYSRFSEPKIVTSYQYSNDQYFKIEILKRNRKQIEGFEEVTNVEENNKRCMIYLSMAQSKVLHDGGCLLIKKGIFPVDVKLTKINNPAYQAVSKKNHNGEIIINNVINVNKYSEPSFNSGKKLKINSSTERITNSKVPPEQTNQILKNPQIPSLVKNRKKHCKNSEVKENDVATVKPKRHKGLEARNEQSMSKEKDNQGDSTIQKEQDVCTNVDELLPIKVHSCNNSKRQLKNSSPTTVVNNEQISEFIGISNPIKNEISPTSNKSTSKAFDPLLINKMMHENIEENEKITEDINTEEHNIVLVENNPIDSNTPRRWVQEIKTITKKTIIIKTREIPAEQIK